MSVDRKTPDRPPRDTSPDPFSPAPAPAADVPVPPPRASAAQVGLQLRWLRFRMPEVQGAVKDLAALASAVAALPVLPAQLSDPAFVVVLDGSAPGFLRTLVAAFASGAMDGQARAAANLCNLLGVIFATFGAKSAVDRTIVDPALCLRALASCASTPEAVSLAALLHAAGVASAADVVRCTARHMPSIAHKAEEWRMGHGLITCLAALAEITDGPSSGTSQQRSAPVSREASISADAVVAGPSTPTAAAQPAPAKSTGMPSKQPSAGSTKNLEALGENHAGDVSTISGVGARATGGDIKTVASPRGIRFPSKVPNNPTPAATLIVASTVISFRRAQLQLPLATTVMWLCTAMRVAMNALEANVGALCLSRSVAGIAAGTVSSSGAPKGSAAPGHSGMTHAGLAYAVTSQTAFGFRQGDQSARAGSPPQGGGGGAPGAANGAGAAFATPRPDRDGVDLQLSAAAVAAVALTSLVKRRRGSKLSDVKQVPHPGRSSGGGELVNIHEATAFLGLRLCAFAVEAPARASTRPGWCSAELREAPVAFLHLTMASLEYLATGGIALTADTQRQFVATLAVLLRTSGLVGDAGKPAFAASPDASPSTSQHARFVDPADGVSTPNPSFVENDAGTDGTFTPDVWNPERRAVLLAFRALDVIVHSRAPAPPAAIIIELRALKRQLSLCASAQDAVLRSACETAWALATIPAEVLTARQPALGSGAPKAPTTPALLGHLPAALHPLSALRDAVPMFHVDQGAWATRVGAAAAKAALAGAASALVPSSTLAAQNAGPTVILNAAAAAGIRAPSLGSRAASPMTSKGAAAGAADSASHASGRLWSSGAVVPLWATSRSGDESRSRSIQAPSYSTSAAAKEGGGDEAATSAIIPRLVNSIPATAYPSVSGAVAVGSVVVDDREGGEFFVPGPIGSRHVSVPAFLKPRSGGSGLQPTGLAPIPKAA